MKAKILKTFSADKRLYHENQIVDIEDERFEFYNSSSHGLLVEMIDNDVDGIDNQGEIKLETMTKKKLVEIASERGISLDIKMIKAEMIKELM